MRTILHGIMQILRLCSLLKVPADVLNPTVTPFFLCDQDPCTAASYERHALHHPLVCLVHHTVQEEHSLMSDAGASHEPTAQRDQALAELGSQLAMMLTKSYELGLDQNAVMPLLDEWRVRVRQTCAQHQAKASS
jgi:hypothetical protein